MPDIQLHTNPITMRPYQEEALHAIDARLKDGKRRLVVVLPTGTGKGLLAAQLPQRLGTTLLLLTHREELLDQHAEEMHRSNPKLSIGIEQADRRAEPTDDIVIASIPTLAGPNKERLARLAARPWNTIVVDEVHHAPAKTWRGVIEQLGGLDQDGPPVIGLTATPTRTDGVGLDTIFQAIAYQKYLPEMIRDGYCSDIRAFAVRSTTNLDRVHARHGDFIEAELAHAVNTPQRNALLVEAWRRLGEDRRTLVFAVDVLHAEAIALSFHRAGIPATSLTGRLHKDERRARLAAFKNGRIHVLVNCEILLEGYDDPPLSCIVMARPTQSALLFSQVIGRGTRTATGKADLLFLDVVDVTSRHHIQTVASLFGLPPRLDLQGRRALETADQIELAITKHPLLRPEQFATAEALLKAAERMTLEVEAIMLTATLAPEVRTEAAFTWVKLPSGDYALPLPDKAGLRIKQNLLDQWEILRLPYGERLSHHPTRQQAFATAEETVRTTHPDLIALASQDLRWRSLPPTSSQINLLRSFGFAAPRTRGEASDLISRFKAAKQAKEQDEPPTKGQRWFLLQRGLWHSGVSRAQARALIIQIAEAERTEAATSTHLPISPTAAGQTQ